MTCCKHDAKTSLNHWILEPGSEFPLSSSPNSHTSLFLTIEKKVAVQASAGA